MTDAVIVSTARTPIGKAHRGALNNTHGADMAAHAIGAAMERAYWHIETALPWALQADSREKGKTGEASSVYAA